ncbi:MAG TPA: HD domain-containing protein [Nitrososphaerales archaeon]|nr:HD domain-containing protein [Nitrososphaerales archaeon]
MPLPVVKSHHYSKKTASPAGRFARRSVNLGSARTHRETKDGEGAESAEIRDPVHGYIYASQVEKTLIDTSSFQRLRRIRQLAGCHLVYPGGQHSRFEHVIGCMYLAGKVGAVLESRDIGFAREDTQKLRIAALLHDIGHGPFSHMFEEVLSEKTDVTHEDMSQRIIRETEIGDILQSNGYSKRELTELAVAKLGDRRLEYMNDAIGGALSVDIMDYLLRDSYFTGVEYGKVDVSRIINSFEVVRDRLAIDQAALFAYEALMIARYQMFRAVYFHRTVRAAELMIIKAMILSDKALHLTDLSLGNYLSLTDEVTLNRIANLNPEGDADLTLAKSLARDYEKRSLLKCAFEKTVQRRDKFLTSIFNQRSFREQFAERIAESAKVDPNQVYLDVPTAPSVPVSSTRESTSSVTLVARRDEKRGKPFSYTIGLQDLPLVGTIAGYMDVVRVYTTAKNRAKVEEAAGKVFGKEGYETRISM